MKFKNWNIELYFGKDMMLCERGWRMFRLGIYKIINLPKEGNALSKNDIKGFILQFKIWFPIDF